jgi:Tfp pilus assembly protein PilN
VLLVAATLLILLTGAHALSYFLRVSVDRAQTELAASAGVVAGLSRAEHDLERTASHVAVARELVKRRSGVAVVLDDVGRVVPSGVWLTELGVEAQERQTLSLTGLAFDEAEVSRLVRSLEGLPRIAALQMTYMQRLSEAESERASGATIWPLVRFELTASVSSFEPNQGARRNQLVEDAP